MDICYIRWVENWILLNQYIVHTYTTVIYCICTMSGEMCKDLTRITHARARAHTHTHTNTHSHTHMHTHIRTHTNTHIHTHTQTHKHIHKHTQANIHIHIIVLLTDTHAGIPTIQRWLKSIFKLIQNTIFVLSDVSRPQPGPRWPVLEVRIVTPWFQLIGRNAEIIYRPDIYGLSNQTSPEPRLDGSKVSSYFCDPAICKEYDYKKLRTKMLRIQDGDWRSYSILMLDLHYIKT